jgi:hypothetical protein
MPRRQKDPLRPLLDDERAALSRLSRSTGAPAARVARARALLLVAEGRDYTTAARLVGRRGGDTSAARCMPLVSAGKRTGHGARPG